MNPRAGRSSVGVGTDDPGSKDLSTRSAWRTASLDPAAAERGDDRYTRPRSPGRPFFLGAFGVPCPRDSCTAVPRCSTSTRPPPLVLPGDAALLNAATRSGVEAWPALPRPEVRPRLVAPGGHGTILPQTSHRRDLFDGFSRGLGGNALDCRSGDVTRPQDSAAGAARPESSHRRSGQALAPSCPPFWLERRGRFLPTTRHVRAAGERGPQRNARRARDEVQFPEAPTPFSISRSRRSNASSALRDHLFGVNTFGASRRPGPRWRPASAVLLHLVGQRLCPVVRAACEVPPSAGTILMP